jgi:hypothetical protein
MNRIHNTVLDRQSRRARALTNIGAMLLVMGFANSAFAEGTSIAVYTGYRDGGSFDGQVQVDPLSSSVSVSSPASSASIEGAETFSASLELPLDEARQIQLFYTYQESSIDLDAVASGVSLGRYELPLRISYAQIGGTNYVSGEVGNGVYVVGGIGATYFDPTDSIYEEELRFSLNLGVGYQLPLGKRVALRFEGRGYFTLINSAGGMFCGNGGCAIAVSGDSIFQGEVLVGLAFRL